MKKNRVILIYLLLSLLVIASAALLAFQIKHYRFERIDSMVEVKKGEVDPDTVKQEAQEKEKLEMQQTLVAFGNTQSFIQLATPVPRPSPTPVPLPSPTPVTPAKGYKIKIATPRQAILQGYDGKEHQVKVGDVVQEPIHGPFEIVAIHAGFGNQRVDVKDVKSGTTASITEMAR